MAYRIPFNKPFIVGKELSYIAEAVMRGNIGGDGYFTQQCARLLEARFAVYRVLLTPSCTAALEMAALLLDLGPGDEVILPSFTFVSTANAVARTGARPVFVDIRPDTLNLDDSLVEEAITARTKAIFPVHYAGVSCEMERIGTIANKYGLKVVEDAAQAVNSWYQGRALGSLGSMGCYSFHETKNYICGEGGALCINDAALLDQAEIIRDKGTNRRKFNRGEVDKYSWVAIGSSYVPSEICSAFLYGQLRHLDSITDQRRRIWQRYYENLRPLEAEGLLRLPYLPESCQGNYHLFYVLLPDHEKRDGLMKHLNERGMQAVFHYVPLHSSPMGLRIGFKPEDLPVTESVSRRLLRLPLYYELAEDEQAEIVAEVTSYVRHQSSAARRGVGSTSC